MNRFSKEVKIGIASVLSIVMLYVGVNYLKGVNLFKPSNYYLVSCSNVRDVNVSSPVFVEGFKVGLVRDIKYDYSAVDKITIVISLDKSMRVNKGSYVTIESTLLSGAELHLNLNKYVSEYHKPGDVLEGRLKSGMMTSVENNLLPQVVELMPKIDSILTGLQTLINDPALSQSLKNLESTTGQLAQSSHQLNRLLQNDVPAIASNLQATTSKFLSFSDELGKLQLEKSINSLNATLDNLNGMTLKMNSSDNSLGLLLNDPLLYNNLNQTVENASALLFDLKQNPKRYVHFSVFGKSSNKKKE